MDKLSFLGPAFILLFVCLLILHVLILLKKTSKRFWVLSDYYWIGLATIGLIGVAKDATKSIAKTHTPQLQSDIRVIYDNCLETIESFVTVYSDTINEFNDPSYSSLPWNRRAFMELHSSKEQEQKENDRNKQILYVKAVKWYINFYKFCDHNSNEILYRYNIEVINNIKNQFKYQPITNAIEFDSSGKEDIEWIQISLNLLEEKIMEINSPDQPDSDWEIFLKLISPFSLAIALAIRFSKVTAQLLNQA